MKGKIKKASLFAILLVSFIDSMGFGLVYPLFSSMLFSKELLLLPYDTSPEMRGFWLGLLIAVMPLTEFFCAPIWGSLSDSHGRKRPLQFSLAMGLIGYSIAVYAVLINSIIFLLVSRLVVGFSAGNISIAQAVVADLSLPEDKTKNFGLFSSSLGAGFALGPFFGGVLSSWGYSVPFLFAAVVIAINIGVLFIVFKETHLKPTKKKILWYIGLINLKKAFHFASLRTILICAFLYYFAWSFFFEFIPVYLIVNFSFSPNELGLFYGLAGIYFALSTGLLIRPFVSRLRAETLLFIGMFFGSLTILAMILITSPLWIYLLMFLVLFFISFITPTTNTLISNSVSPKIQGEAFGVLNAIIAVAFFLSPLTSGSLVGAYPSLPLWVGGIVILGSAIIALARFRMKIFRLP